jgi:hypothetical protein
MNNSIEQHLKEYKKNLKGWWVEKNNGYEGYICEALNMIPRKSRYWDAEWQGVLLEFKKGRSIWLDLVRYSEILLKVTTEASQPTITLFFVPSPSRDDIEEIVITDTDRLIEKLKLNEEIASSLIALNKHVPRQLNAQASLTLSDVRKMARAII